MTVEGLRRLLDGHEPAGDFDGFVCHCACGWEGTLAEDDKDYRDHAADVIAASLKGDDK